MQVYILKYISYFNVTVVRILSVGILRKIKKMRKYARIYLSY